MSEEKTKIIEKHYIEVNASAKNKFLMGLIQGLGWGVGVTLGTAALIILIGYLATRIDWVPILGSFVQNVVDKAQTAPIKR